MPKVSHLTLQRAKELRANMTECKRIIWSHLRSKRMLAKFNRQRPIGEYICDFVSVQVGIIIEIDGGQHYEREHKEYDARRDEYLRSFGFEILRFTNLDVEQNLEGVLTVIWDKISATLPPACGGELKGGRE